MNVLKKICCVLMLAGATAAQATPLEYTFTGPKFTSASGPFTTDSRITGSLKFDSSLLNSQGDGNFWSVAGYNAGFEWAFDDGFNHFDNLNTLYNFQISLSFDDFQVAGWYIDTTFGWTYNDIFVDGSHNHSIYQGNLAFGPSVSAANWAKVPEPGSMALMGLGMAGLAALRRRKQPK